jgi:hypothetical protein
MNERPARAISHSVFGCPQVESKINGPPGPGELPQPLEALGDQRHLGRVPRFRAHVQRDPVRGRGLQRPDLASDALSLRPAVGDQAARRTASLVLSDSVQQGPTLLG